MTDWTTKFNHYDVIKWKPFPRHWPFVWGIHRSPVNSQHKGQWRGALVFSLIFAWLNGWVNTLEAGDWRRHRVHYDVTVMLPASWSKLLVPLPLNLSILLPTSYLHFDKVIRDRIWTKFILIRLVNLLCLDFTHYGSYIGFDNNNDDNDDNSYDNDNDNKYIHTYFFYRKCHLRHLKREIHWEPD